MKEQTQMSPDTAATISQLDYERHNNDIENQDIAYGKMEGARLRHGALEEMGSLAARAVGLEIGDNGVRDTVDAAGKHGTGELRHGGTYARIIDEAERELESAKNEVEVTGRIAEAQVERSAQTVANNQGAFEQAAINGANAAGVDIQFGGQQYSAQAAEQVQAQSPPVTQQALL